MTAQRGLFLAFERADVGLGVWLQWVLASTLALLVAVVALGAITRFSGLEFEGVRDYAMIGSFIGAVTGVVQWLVLRRQMPSGGWAGAVVWMLSMGLVGAAGLAAGLAPRQTLSVLGTAPPQGFFGVVLVTCALGAVAGTLQWGVLRTRVSGAGWWILANAVAAPAGLASGELVSGLGGVPVGGAVFLFITGGVLVWLLSHPASAQSHSAPQ